MAMALLVWNSDAWTGLELDLVLNGDIYYLLNPPGPLSIANVRPWILLQLSISSHKEKY